MDGVIWREKAPLPGAKETIIFLTQELKQMDPVKYCAAQEGAKMPFIFMTNSGAQLEQDRCDKVNQLFDLPVHHQIDAEHVILNFTPLREEMGKYKDKVVLIAGQENYEKVAIDTGMNMVQILKT